MKELFGEYGDIIIVYLFSSGFTAGFIMFYKIFSKLLMEGI